MYYDDDELAGFLAAVIVAMVVGLIFIIVYAIEYDDPVDEEIYKPAPVQEEPVKELSIVNPYEAKSGDKVYYTLRVINGMNMLCDDNDNCFEQPRF